MGIIDAAIDRLVGGRQLWSVVGMDAANAANQHREDALVAERDYYRDALERAARLAELEPGSLVGQVVREALNDPSRTAS